MTTASSFSPTIRWIDSFFVVLLVSALLAATHAQAQDHQQLGSDIVGSGFSRTHVVTLSGDGSTLAVGSPLASTVRVYQWSGSAWSPKGTVLSGESSGDSFGWAVSLSSNGAVLAVGAPLNDGVTEGSDTGHVRVYDWTGTTWLQRGPDIDGPLGSMRFGYAVALSPDGNKLASGGPGRDGVQVLRWNGQSAWGPLGNTILGPDASSFGQSVALSEDDGLVLAVGAGNDGTGFAGSVRVYDGVDGVWVLRGNPIYGNGGDYLGASVALNGDATSLIAGGYGFNSAGRAVVMDWNGMEWSQRGADLTGYQTKDWFGLSVGMSLDGFRVIVGAPQHPSASDRPGYARLYEWTGTQWAWLGSNLTGNSKEGYGQSVAISRDGGTAAVGAIYTSTNGKDSGRVQVFEVGSSLQTPPRAHTVIVSGLAQVAGTLSARYTFEDDESSESGSTFQWFRVTGNTRTAIEGATSATYAPVSADIGSRLVFVVTPKDGFVFGDPAESDVIGPIEAGPKVRLVSVMRHDPLTESIQANVVTFRAVFDREVYGVDAGDFSPTGTLAPGASPESVSEITPTTYDVRVALPASDGTIGLGVRGVDNVGGTSDIAERSGVFQEAGSAFNSFSSDWNQTFTAPVSGQLLEIQVPFTFNFSARTVALDLYAGPASKGKKLASVTLNLPEIASLTWVRAQFATPIPVTAGQMYNWRILHNGYSGVLRSGANPYPGGTQLALGVLPITGADLAFRAIMSGSGLVPSASAEVQSYTVISNQRPTATHVSVAGVLEVGETLHGSYTYSDSENDLESGTAFAWFRADDEMGTNASAIAGATTTSHTLGSADRGKYISFRVTPSDGGGAGSPTASGFTGPVRLPGTVAVASILRRNPATEVTNAGEVTFRVTFTGAVINVDPSDFMVTGTANAGAVTHIENIDGRSFDVTVSGVGNANGTLGLAIKGVAGAPGENDIGTAGDLRQELGGASERIGGSGGDYPWIVQTFTAPASVGMTGLEVSLIRYELDQVQIDVDIAPESAPNDVLANARITATDLVHQFPGTLYRINWPEPVSLEQGVAYRLTFSPLQTVRFEWHGTSPYPGGKLIVPGEDWDSPDLRFAVLLGGAGGTLKSDAPAESQAYTMRQNARPTAPNVQISGTLEVGATLTGSYAYSDEEDDEETGTTLVWYRADDAHGTNARAISGALSYLYTPASVDRDRYLSFEVTPSDAGGPGTPALSSWAGPVVLPRTAAVTSIRRQNPTDQVTNADELVFRVAFDRRVDNVDENDFSLTGTAAGGAIARVADIDGATFDVTVTGLDDAEGTLGLAILGVAGTPGENDIQQALDGLRQDLGGVLTTVGAESPGSATWVAQSFTLPESHVSTGAEVVLVAVGPTELPLSVHFTLSANATPTDILGEATITAHQFSATVPGQLYRASWSAPVSLEAGTQYRLTMTPSAQLGIDGSSSDPYPNGTMITSSGALGSADLRFAILYSPTGLLKRDPPSESQTYTLRQNTAPIAAPDHFTLHEDGPIHASVLTDNGSGADSDPEGDELSVSGVDAPQHGSLILGVDGTFSYIPAADYNGPDGFTYAISDGKGGTAVGTVTLTILPVNDPPRVLTLGDQVVNEDVGAVSVPGWAHSISPGPADESAQVVRFLVEHESPSLFAVGPAVSQDGTLTFTPAPNANGAGRIKVTALDNGGTERGGVDRLVLPLVITVTPVDDPPEILLPPSAQVLEDGELIFSELQGNAIRVRDIDLGEGQLVLELTATSTVSAKAASGLVLSGNGGHLVTLSGTLEAVNSGLDGLVYRPSPNQDTGGRIILRATATGASATAELPIAILAVNDPPTFTMGTDPVVDEDAAALTVPGWARNISAGAESEAGQILDFQLVAVDPSLFADRPAVSPDGTLTFAPYPGRSGSSAILIRLSDNGGTGNGGRPDSEWQTFTITVVAVNDPPVLRVPGTISLMPGETRSIEGIWVSDEDVGGTLMTVSLSSSGQLTLGDTSEVIITSGSNGSGAFSFSGTLSGIGRALATLQVRASSREAADITIEVSDGGGTGRGGVLTTSATIPVSVSNRAPTAREDSDFSSGEPVRISVLFNDFDEDGDPLALQSVGTPLGGLVAMDGQAVIYTPMADFAGMDEFDYTVSDSHGALSKGRVSVRVAPFAPGPDLDGIDGEIENGAPGNGDGNGDGIPDAEQSHVTSIPIAVGDRKGEYLTLVARGGEQLARVNSKSIPAPEGAPPGSTFPVGQIGFNVENLEPGHSMVVEVQLPRGVEVVSYYKYGPVLGDPTPSWHEFLFDGTVGAVLHPETEKRGPWIALHLRDGLDGDSDLTANGRIVDPGIPVLRADALPVAVADSIVVDEDTAITFYPAANDVDPEGAHLSIDGVSRPESGKAVVGENGAVTYTPNPDYYGEDWFFYTISDQSGRPVTGRVHVTVRPVADRIWAVPDTAYAAPGELIVIPIFANDRHPDGEYFFLAAIGKAAHGTATYRSQRYVHYRPMAGFTGVDQFTYSIGDLHGQIDRTTVTVYVGVSPAGKGPEPDPSMAPSEAESAEENIPESFYLAQNYPNPFNPRTTLVFGLDQPGLVRIELFDAVGRRVRVLLDEDRSAGHYQESVDLGDLPSGLYLCRVSTGSRALTRSLHLLK